MTDKEISDNNYCDKNTDLNVPSDPLLVATLLEHLTKLLNLFSQTLDVMAEI